MEILHYWKLIRKRILLILMLVVMALFGAVYSIQSQVPKYTSTATLFINPSNLGSVLPYQLAYTIGPLANTYSEYMKTRSFAAEVAAALPVELSEGQILAALNVEYVRDTQILKISATHMDPVVAMQLADMTAKMLIQSNRQRQQNQLQEQIEAQRSPEKVRQRQQMEELLLVLTEELQYYQDQIQLINDEIANIQRGPASAEATERILALRSELLQLRSERVAVLSSMSDSQNQLAQMEVQPVAEVDTAVIVDPALVPQSPDSRNVLQPIVAALVVALAFGFALAWGLEYIDYTVKSPEDLDEVYGMPTQGAIGFVPGSGSDEARPAGLVALRDPRSPVMEAIRSLRTSVRMASAIAPIRSLLITSAGPGEGKTFVAANLAVSFAQEGRSVILVDLDLRRPQVHAAFSLPREPGFTDILADRERNVEETLRTTTASGLRVLTAGTIPPHPAELLGSPRTDALMLELEKLADIIVYDTAPAATVTDAVLVAPHVDGVLQVVLARGTRKDMVRRCKVLLERAQARLLGPVLNCVHADDLGYYSNYYSNYYSYSGYYHEKDAKGTWWRRILGRRRQPTANLSAASLPARGSVGRNGIGANGGRKLIERENSPQTEHYVIDLNN